MDLENDKLRNEVNNNHNSGESEVKMSLAVVNGEHSCYDNNEETQSNSGDEAGISSQIDSDAGTQSSVGSLGSPGIVNSPMIKTKCFYGSGSSSLPKSRFKMREESLPFEQRSGKQTEVKDDLNFKRQNKSSKIARTRSKTKQKSSPYPMKHPRAKECPKKRELVKKPGLMKVVNKNLSDDCIAKINAGKAIVPLPNGVDSGKGENISQSPMFSSDADSQDSVKRKVKILVSHICRKYEAKWNGNDSEGISNTAATEGKMPGVVDNENLSIDNKTDDSSVFSKAGCAESKRDCILEATKGLDSQTDYSTDTDDSSVFSKAGCAESKTDCTEGLDSQTGLSADTKDIIESNNHTRNSQSSDYDEDSEDDTGISLCSFMDTSRNISFTEKEASDENLDDQNQFCDPTDIEDFSSKNKKRRAADRPEGPDDFNSVGSKDEKIMKVSTQLKEKIETSPMFSVTSSNSSSPDIDTECQLLLEEFEVIENAYAMEDYEQNTSEQKWPQEQSSKKKASSSATGLLRYFQKTSKDSGKDCESSEDCMTVSVAKSKTENLKGNNVGKLSPQITQSKRQLKITSTSDAKSPNGDVAIEDLTPSVASPKNAKKPRKPSTSPKTGGQKFEQLYIDVGQKNFGHITCPDCGMVYTKTLPEDALQHSKYHQKLMQKLKFRGWKTERVLQEFHDGRIIQINQNDNSLHLKKGNLEVLALPTSNQVAELREVVDGELGFAYASTEYSSVEKESSPKIFNPVICLGNVITHLTTKSKLASYLKQQIPLGTRLAFLFVSNNKIIGCAIAVPITKAYPVITTKDTPSPEKRQGVPTLSWCCSSDPVHALCGISRIWVLKKARRQKVAMRLIDAVRSHFIFGVVIGKDKLAFSDPTPGGRLFAEKYSETPNILVFR